MGKRIISQARGRGGPAYRVRDRAFLYRISYPKIGEKCEGVVIALLNTSGNSSPIAKIKTEKEIFFVPAVNGLYEGKKIIIMGEEISDGNILELGKIPIGTKVFNLERHIGDGGKLIRAGGGFATITKKLEKETVLIMPSKKEITIDNKCRAIIGFVSGQGRVIKPFVTAGKKWFKMKAKSKLWPRTSAVKMNSVDHPFGGGRGKRIKSKIAKRNAPAGRRVGHIRPSRTGRR